MFFEFRMEKVATLSSARLEEASELREKWLLMI